MGSAFSTPLPHKSSDAASFHGEFGSLLSPLDTSSSSTQASPSSSFHGELNALPRGSAVDADADTDGLLLRSKERKSRWRPSPKARRKKNFCAQSASCFPSMQNSAGFVCGICPTRVSAASQPWWTCSRPTVFGLRKDGNTWERCVVANEHLNYSTYVPPPLWKRLLRRLRAQARKADCWHACYAHPHPNAFHYDPASYALNFDDSPCCMQHHQHQLYCPHSQHAMPLVDPLDSSDDDEDL